MKNSILYLVSALVIICFIILINGETLLISDKINIASIAVNVFIAVIIVSYFQSKESNSRTLKDYFINEVNSLKMDYNEFIVDIKNSNITSNSIKRKFKDFSIRNEQIEYFLKKEIKLSTLYIQDQNRKIHRLVTNSTEFNNVSGLSQFTISTSNNNELIELHKEFNHHLTNLVIKINKT
jgi:hypothetical protein